MKTTKFKKDLAIGRIGELLVIRFLETKGWEVIDYEANRAKQSQGVDLEATKDGTKYLIEVKYDLRSEETGNFYIEVETWGKSGWLYTTKSDFLFMLNTKVLYIVKPENLRDYYEARKVGLVCGGDCAKGFLLRESALRKLAAQVVQLDGVF